ncbi:MAG: DUF86 domain-containing protein [Saprospiraceae bacterium]
MLESAQYIEAYTTGMGFNEFSEDTRTRDAVVRNFEIIGEAANNLPEELTQKYKNIDWPGIVGFRNVLIHNYFGVDYAMLWDVLQTFLPELKERLTLILLDLENQPKE